MKKKTKLSGVAIIIILIISSGILIWFFTPWLKQKLSNWAKNKVVTYVADNSDYTLKIDSLSIEGLSAVQLHQVSLVNKISKEEFNKKNKYQTDWIRFETDKINFNGIKWKNWFSDEGIRMEEMQMENPEVYVYRDKRKPREPYVIKPLPVKFLRESKQSLTVPVIRVTEGRVQYEEVVSGGKGKVSFTHLMSVVENFSTDQAYIADHPELTMKASAMFLDSVKVEVNYGAEINNRNDEFTLSGKIESFQAGLMNQFLEPLARFKIKSGLIRDLTFRFKGDKDKANGTLEMKYENLETEVMKKDKPEKKSKVKTWLANVLVKDQNVRNSTESDYKKGVIAYERKKNFSVFHYWLNAVKSGVFSIVTDINISKIKEVKDKISK